jgi:hypothetical protein
MSAPLGAAVLSRGSSGPGDELPDQEHDADRPEHDPEDREEKQYDQPDGDQREGDAEHVWINFPRDRR